MKPDNQAGKGDKARPVNKRQFDECPLWKNVGPDSRKEEAMSEEEIRECIWCKKCLKCRGISGDFCSSQCEEMYIFDVKCSNAERMNE